MLKITSAQINPTIGDITGNIALMLRAARQARDSHADMVVFPELSLTAYYPADLLDDASFQRRLDAGLEQLKLSTREAPALHWIVGAPMRREGTGKPFHNALLVLKNGEIVLQYNKQLLPTYNIFDERRHFEPGADMARVLRIGDKQVGLMICEDGWNDDGQDYAVNPFQRLADAAPDLVVSINASPSNIGKREQRHTVFGNACSRHRLPLLYVNQIGGHDQLVFDGASFAMDATGKVVYEAQRFAEDITTLTFSSQLQTFSDAQGESFAKVEVTGLPTMEFYRQQIVLGLKDYARRCGFTTAVVGCSGGIDSALTLALAVEALGAANVVGITMPSKFSSEGSVSDSQTLCRNLGITLIEHPIRSMVASFEEGFAAAFGKPLQGLPLENLQARVRGTTLMEYSNAFGHLLLTTGNKSEVSVGYCTLYGDTNGGLGLIGDLYKTEIFALCRHINATAGRELIPVAIIDKPPSAELAPGQKDTDSLPPYEVLDEILKSLIEGARLPDWEHARAEQKMADLRADPAGRAMIERIQKMIARNEYKRRQAPPVLRLRGRAFGSGRQVPIAAVQYA
ncbi:NAD+ synthase [Rhodoferax aquaticus]|uniref:Glutamine-dependent NAD(+) synthetase n=1 Tax=Rhodoferax aquaticus TaxID=2527691 RepID=A0A515ESZ1_9BURK|nr:NAD+ synthase [Rhodoferax aquaticus]QDL55785.1 NAD+ synthase [Rhodoferax aquaticus]